MTGTDNATGEPAVWILRYSHKHGEDLSAHATPEGADAAIAGIVRDWWADEMKGEDGVPETPDALTDAEAVMMYFAHMDGRSYPEEYDIERLKINP